MFNGSHRVALDPGITMDLLTSIPRGYALLYSRTRQHYRVALTKSNAMHELGRLQWHISHVANRAFSAALEEARQFDLIARLDRKLPYGTHWEWVRQKTKRSERIHHMIGWYKVTDFGNRPIVVLRGPDGNGFATGFDALAALLAEVTKRMKWSDYREMRKRGLAELAAKKTKPKPTP